MTRLINGALLVLFGTLLGALLLLITLPPRGHPVVLRPAPTPAPVVVHVAGGVARPGVYELPSGARVRDAIAAAGGLQEPAAGDTLNLAAQLEDGDQVLVPRSGGQETGEPAAAPSEEGLIDINTASQEELETLPGIGPSIARSIIEYREQQGAFEKPADIVKVSGIGPSTYEKIKNRITTQP